MPVFTYENNQLETRYLDIVEITSGFYEGMRGSLQVTENTMGTDSALVKLDNSHFTVKVLFSQVILIQRREGYIQE